MDGIVVRDQKFLTRGRNDEILNRQNETARGWVPPLAVDYGAL